MEMASLGCRRLRVGNRGFANFATGRLGDIFLVGAEDAALHGADDVMRIVVALNGQLDPGAGFAMKGKADLFVGQSGRIILVDSDDDIPGAKTEIGRRAARESARRCREARRPYRIPAAPRCGPGPGAPGDQRLERRDFGSVRPRSLEREPERGEIQ